MRFSGGGAGHTVIFGLKVECALRALLVLAVRNTVLSAAYYLKLMHRSDRWTGEVGKKSALAFLEIDEITRLSEANQSRLLTFLLLHILLDCPFSEVRYQLR